MVRNEGSSKKVTFRGKDVRKGCSRNSMLSKGESGGESSISSVLQMLVMLDMTGDRLSYFKLGTFRAFREFATPSVHAPYSNWYFGAALSLLTQYSPYCTNGWMKNVEDIKRRVGRQRPMREIHGRMK